MRIRQRLYAALEYVVTVFHGLHRRSVLSLQSLTAIADLWSYTQHAI